MSKLTSLLGTTTEPPMMEIIRVIKNDLDRNYPGREYRISDIVLGISKWSSHDRCVFYARNVIVTLLQKSEDGLEFHCINGGDGKDLSEALIDMFSRLRTGFKTAVTYYDSPRITQLLHHLDLPFGVAKVDGGLDKTFEACFELKGV